MSNLVGFVENHVLGLTQLEDFGDSDLIVDPECLQERPVCS